MGKAAESGSRTGQGAPLPEALAAFEGWTNETARPAFADRAVMGL
jgi:hypothetical protein